MKRLLILISTIALVGVGCFGTKSETFETDFIGATYENNEFGFAFDYPETMEVRTRPQEDRSYEYIGMNTDFFASLRDTTELEQPVSLVWMMAIPRTNIEQFSATLEGADEAIKIKSIEEVEINDLTLTKVVNETAMEVDKTHYLLNTEDGLTIIFSVFLNTDEDIAPVLETLRKFSQK